MKLAFGRDKHLKSKKRIAELFSVKSAITCAPFRLVFFSSPTSHEARVEVLVSIPKKRVNLAVKRNRIRRQAQECVRLELPQLEANLQDGFDLVIGLVYIGKGMPTFSEVQSSIQNIVKRLSKKIRDSHEKKE